MAKRKDFIRVRDGVIITKPWGYEQVLSLCKGLCHKNLVVLEGHKLSLQSHEKRSETWHISHGECMITIGKNEYLAFPGTKWFIAPGVRHTVEAVKHTVIEEFSEGYDPEDIIRYADRYGRTTNERRKN